MNLTIDWKVSSEIIPGWATPNLYGLLFVTGLVIGFFVIKKMFKKEGIPEALLDKLLIYIVLATIIGARLGHVFSTIGKHIKPIQLRFLKFGKADWRLMVLRF